MMQSPAWIGDILQAFARLAKEHGWSVVAIVVVAWLLWVYQAQRVSDLLYRILYGSRTVTVDPNRLADARLRQQEIFEAETSVIRLQQAAAKREAAATLRAELDAANPRVGGAPPPLKPAAPKPKPIPPSDAKPTMYGGALPPEQPRYRPTQRRNPNKVLPLCITLLLFLNACAINIFLTLTIFGFATTHPPWQ